MKNMLNILLALLFLLAVAGSAPPEAYATPETPDLPFAIYLPFLVRGPSSYAVSGTVRDATGSPLPGALITGSEGQTTLAGVDGSYQLMLAEGSQALAPSLDGYMFAPAVHEIAVSGDTSGQDFVALQACSQVLENGGFESNTWWNFPTSQWPAVYSTDIVHNGARSVRTGIRDQADNRYSYSSLRSPAMAIPTDTDSAKLRLWLFPISSEATLATIPQAPDGPAFGDATTAYDAQYVMVLDGSNNLLETLLWIRSNNQMWTYHEFNLSKWAGTTVKIQVGVYNDGSDGVTALYVDDASLQLCSDSPPPPEDPPTCANHLGNSGFEYNGAWGIPVTEYPAAYSSDYAYEGWRSMRTGVPLWSGIDKLSYSDAWQTVTIPADATSAKLRVKLLPRSQELDHSTTSSIDITPPKTGAVWGEAPLSYDAQYILILNPYDGTIRETLLWYYHEHSTAWEARVFDLMHYRNQTIRIQFGSYNDGNYYRSAMYVDEADVDICTSTITVTPTEPPPVCTEEIDNGSFEYTDDWYIPFTEFSAGYSTYLKRTGARSMRSGIYYLSHNRYSYSDFRQTVYVPHGLSQAKLSFWSYAISGEVYSNAPDLAEKPTEMVSDMDTLSGDVQYLLLLDYYGNWIDTLVWRRSNEQFWRYWEFDLRPYAGTTLQIQFGTYNNGWSGVTSMYVDDVSLWLCP
ncbi:carboxypeptidase-like regulatory domain-containing protein [Chloroflexota bacterium]